MSGEDKKELRIPIKGLRQLHERLSSGPLDLARLDPADLRSRKAAPPRQPPHRESRTHPRLSDHLGHRHLSGQRLFLILHHRPSLAAGAPSVKCYRLPPMRSDAVTESNDLLLRRYALPLVTGDSYSEASGGFLVLARGSSRTCADCKRMKPQLAQVRGNASVFLSTDLLPMTCSSATRSSHPCHCSWPQNGQLMRASRLLRKSKMRFTRITPVQGDVVASPSLARTLSAGRCARSSVWPGCRDFAVVVGGSKGLAGFAGAWLRPAGF